MSVSLIKEIMVGALLLTGFVVGLDNFRVAAALGTLKLPHQRRLQIALAFCFCEALAPIVGLILGNVLIKSILPWGESMGIVVLGGSGLYLICRAWIDEVPDQPFDRNWVIFVLPISLSFDNLFAGAGLGMLGGPIFISAIVIGVMSGMMCMIGLLVGGVVARYLPSRVELFTGVLLLVLAALAIGN